MHFVLTLELFCLGFEGGVLRLDWSYECNPEVSKDFIFGGLRADCLSN